MIFKNINSRLSSVLLKKIKVLPVFILCSFIILGFTKSAFYINFEDDGVLEIEGWVLSDKDDPLNKANVTVFRDGNIIHVEQTNSRGKFNFNLATGSVYTAVFSKDGYVSKKISFNGELPNDFDGFNYFYFEFIVELFPYVKGVDYTILETPFVEIAYIEDSEEFFFEEQKSRPNLARISDLKNYTYRYLEYRDDYESLIKAADKLLEQDDYFAAMETYNNALALLPKEKHPQKQIDYIFTKLAEDEDIAELSTDEKMPPEDDLTSLEIAESDMPEEIIAAHEDETLPGTDRKEKETDLVVQVKEKPVHETKPENNIFAYFDFASYYVDEKSAKMADNAIQYLKQNPDMNMVLYGHSDTRGNPVFNFFLSQLRAQAAYNYCISKGISPDRLLTLADGQNQPLIENAIRESEHRTNRRVEFEFVDNYKFKEMRNNTPKLSFRHINDLETNNSFSPGVEIMVQFIAAKNPIGTSYFHKIFQGYPGTNIIYYYDTDMLHRYLVGSYQTLDEAESASEKMNNLGYDTYVVAFNNGKRISLEEVR